MKSKLIGLLFALSTLIIFTSYNSKPYYCNHLVQKINNSKEEKFDANSKIYIPFEKELREIEQEEYKKDTNDCRHKGLKYQKILTENNEISCLATGWVSPYKDLHVWIYVLNKKTKEWHIVDPTWIKEKDGLTLEYYPKKEVHYLFGKDVTLKGIENKRNYWKKFPENIKKFSQFLEDKK